VGEGLGGLGGWGCRKFLKDSGWEILGCGKLGRCGGNGPGLGFVENLGNEVFLEIR
jgi:hypothetical protein